MDFLSRKTPFGSNYSKEYHIDGVTSGDRSEKIEKSAGYEALYRAMWPRGGAIRENPSESISRILKGTV
jgi:hypothetical protein